MRRARKKILPIVLLVLISLLNPLTSKAFAGEDIWNEGGFIENNVVEYRNYNCDVCQTEEVNITDKIRETCVSIKENYMQFSTDPKLDITTLMKTKQHKISKSPVSKSEYSWSGHFLDAHSYSLHEEVKPVTGYIYKTIHFDIGYNFSYFPWIIESKENHEMTIDGQRKKVSVYVLSTQNQLVNSTNEIYLEGKTKLKLNETKSIISKDTGILLGFQYRIVYLKYFERNNAWNWVSNKVVRFSAYNSENVAISLYKPINYGLITVQIITMISVGIILLFSMKRK